MQLISLFDQVSEKYANVHIGQKYSVFQNKLIFKF